MHTMFNRLQKALKEVLDFQSRLWVVNVYTGEKKGESFVVNEDSFNEPLQWMKSKGYNQAMLHQVDTMKRSQVIELSLPTVQHRLMRVK
ncbi:hypothetical protein [Vibrio sp. 10N.261.55.A7]|uniref:hypothetical protein n=1 Tax=Vibrio sp. 10N.261.55.A7 TaxID=1880851 RepID=UPI000C816C9B|nr:hypothetical protein [Vibrio sp. 10N.261.55.A7]